MKTFLSSAKEVAQIAVMVALLLGGQLALSSVGGVEVVTILLLAYCYVFGWQRGTIVALAFVLLRNFVFGLHLPALVLYAIYYPSFALFWGSIGKKIKSVWALVAVACICTIIFTCLDNVIQPIFNFFSPYVKWNCRATWLYITASIPFALVQTLCTFFSVLLLFKPITKIFFVIDNGNNATKNLQRK